MTRPDRRAGDAAGGDGAASRLEPGSFRDRTARVFYADGRVFRGLTGVAADEWRALAATSFFPRQMAEGAIVGTQEVVPTPANAAAAAQWSAVLEHDRLPFVSYPYEWSFGMLQDAALLQLDLVSSALREGFTLKDCSSFNIQWVGARPVFIDVPSFVRRHKGEPWVGYRQFCQLFLYPLLLQAYKNIPFHPWLRGSLEGIDATDCRRLMSARDLLRPGVLTHVVLTSFMQRRQGARQDDVREELKTAGFSADLIQANVRKLSRVVTRLRWTADESPWVDYASCNTYDQADDQAKEQFVGEVLETSPRHLVWDLGCNTGRFSRLAARHADHVIALDADHAAVERLYQALKREGPANILPLVLNVADPSPDQGWRGMERKSVPLRAQPDLVIALALIHHLVISANLPVVDVIEWLADLGSDLVIEFVTRDDPMVKHLLRNKQQAYDDYQTDYFERCLAASFDIRARVTLPSGRRKLYYGVPRVPAAHQASRS